MRFVVFYICLFFPLVAMAEKRVALVIGNSAYEHVSHLPNPQNDATDIAEALKRLGFDVDRSINMSFRDTRLALRDFSAKASDADVALIYYAGHGVEIDRKNYMIPVNAEIKSDRDVEFEAIPLDQLLSAIQSSAGLKIVLLDACRNNPFLASMERTNATRSIGRGLARIEPSNILVGYAAREGTLALDGGGRNSPYARALLDHLEQPGLELGKMLRKVRDQVFRTTEGLQEPFIYGSLPAEDIFLKTGPQSAALALSARQPDPQEEKLKELLAGFGDAQKLDTLFGWDSFLEKYQTFAEHPVYKAAVLQRDAAKTSDKAYLLEQLRKREIWMEGVDVGSGGQVNLSSAQRKPVQEALNLMGYDVGVVDGQFGAKTRAALQRARLDANLEPGTSVDADVLKLLPNIYATREYLRPKVARFNKKDLPAGLERRMHKAITVLEGQIVGKPYKFSYFDGHLYVLIFPHHTTMDFANDLARNMNGHLATISSASENRHLTDMFKGDPAFVKTLDDGSTHGPSFGLFQIAGSKEPADGWSWMSGEPFKYRNWAQSSPDNYEKNEKFGNFYGEFGEFPATWNDDNTFGWAGYIIEIPPQN
ncbi:MAG: caspase family protein [Pseudomonadota bacterium]